MGKSVVLLSLTLPCNHPTLSPPGCPVPRPHRVSPPPNPSPGPPSEEVQDLLLIHHGNGSFGSSRLADSHRVPVIPASALVSQQQQQQQQQKKKKKKKNKNLYKLRPANKTDHTYTARASQPAKTKTQLLCTALHGSRIGLHAKGD